MKTCGNRRKPISGKQKKRLSKRIGRIRWDRVFAVTILLVFLSAGLYAFINNRISDDEPLVAHSCVNQISQIPPQVVTIIRPKPTATTEAVAVHVVNSELFRGLTIHPIYQMLTKAGVDSKMALSITNAYTKCGNGSIPPEIVVGVIATESGFDPSDVSYAGAKGIMQLLPDTFYSYAYQYPKLFPKKDIFDVYENVCAGILYLQDSYSAWSSYTASKAEVIDLAVGSYLMGVQGLKNLSDSPTKAVTNDNYFVSEYVKRVKTYAGAVDSIR